MAPWGLYSTQSVTRLYPAASAASVVLNFAVASRTFITSRSTTSLYPLGRMPGAWLVSLSPACTTGAIPKVIVTNKNPVSPLNFFIAFVLFGVSPWLQLDADRNPNTEQTTGVFDGLSRDNDELV